MSSFYSHLKRGFTFIRKNPQSLYSLFVLVIIVASFLFVASRFAQVTLDTKIRLQRITSSSIQDTITPFLRDKIDSPEELQVLIEEVVKENDPITEFKIIKFIDGKDIILVSLDKNEIGTENKSTYYQNIAEINPDKSFSFSSNENGENFLITTRIFTDENGKPVGYLLIKEGRAASDDAVADDIQKSYIILAFIIILIAFLFVRHARIIDYSALYKRLKEVDSMKDDFISMASHELRSPLTVIKGYADEAKREDIEVSTKNEHIGKIAIASKRLSDLVEDMLDVSRLQEGRMKFEVNAIDPEPIINETVENFKMTNEKDIAISFNKIKSSKINIDEDRLRQIMVNLVGNSVKYTNKGEIKVESDIKDSKFEIKVSDTGIGISAEDQKNLFQKFERVKSDETRGIVGTGLGLWITKQMIEKMNGEIHVESIKGTGTTFIVKFPVAK